MEADSLEAEATGEIHAVDAAVSQENAVVVNAVIAAAVDQMITAETTTAGGFGG